MYKKVCYPMDVNFFETNSLYILFSHTIQAIITAIRNNSPTLLLENIQIVNQLTAEEGGAILAGGLVEDSFGLLGLEPLHAPLNGRLAEVVGVRLHRQPVNAHHRMFLGGIAVAVRFIAPCHFQNPLSNIRLPGSGGFHNALDEGFRHIGVNRQQLLCLAVYSNPDKSPIIGVYYAAIYFAGQL